MGSKKNKRKSSKAKFDGLKYLLDHADVVWEVKPEKPENGTDKIRLTNVKSNYFIGFTDFVVSADRNKGTVSYTRNILPEDEIPVKDAIIEYLNKHPNANQSDIVQAVKPLTPIGEKHLRAVLGKLVSLHILEIRWGKGNAKIYNIK